MNVPFAREIHQGDVGDDVIGHKRALSRANPKAYPWPKQGAFTPLAGQFFMDALVKDKHAHGLGITRVLGAAEHQSLERRKRAGHPTEPAFDARAIQLCTDYYEAHHLTPDQRIRAAVVAAGYFWYQHRAAIAYSQYRPYPVVKPPTVPSRFDCSGFATACYFAGGAHDPNGRGFDGQGYTGTLIANGTLVHDISQLKLADLIFFGYSSGRPGFNVGDPTHVAVYVGLVNDVPSVLSMGHYPMSLYPFNYRAVNQMRTYQVT